MKWNDIRVIPPKIDQDILVLLAIGYVQRAKFIEIEGEPTLVFWGTETPITEEIVGWKLTDAPGTKPVTDSEMGIPAPVVLYHFTPGESAMLDCVFSAMRERAHREGDRHSEEYCIAKLKHGGHTEAAKFLQDEFDLPF